VKPLRTIFAGTPAFAVPALEALLASGHRPLAVLTQPDRGAGRGRRVAYGPVKQLAVDAGVEVLQPTSLKTAEVREQLAALKPDLLITAAYGLLLPQVILDLPVHGCWNLHASLLPRWRGASPINQAILAGDAETGISLMQMEAGLDTGPVLLQASTRIDPDENAGQLHDRLSAMAAAVLIDSLDRLVSGQLPAPARQNPSLATHAPMIDKADARLDWSLNSADLARMVRAYNPWPIAFGEIEGIQCRVFRAAAVVEDSGPPGHLVREPGLRDRVRVACGAGALDIFELQAPGRKRVSARDWLNAHPDWMRP
jgi:methionyl-tRNA formyltransferase